MQPQQPARSNLALWIIAVCLVILVLFVYLFAVADARAHRAQYDQQCKLGQHTIC